MTVLLKRDRATWKRRVFGGVPAILIAVAIAGCGSNGGSKAPVRVEGTDPTIGAKRAGSNTLNNSVVAKPDSNGIITYDGYQSVVARSGDSVSKVAARVGLSASELGAYNGLSASHVLRNGDELVLPPRPGGYGPNGPQAAVTAPATPTIQAPARTASIEQTPIGGTATAEVPAVETAPQDTGTTETPGWSPDIAAAAIERSTGLQDDGTLAAPPSATAPTPPEPAKRRELDSPNLAQYQTEDSTAAASPTPRPESGATSATSPSVTSEETQVAGAPAAATLNLVRPVKGPVAIGFNKGAGPSRNDGVDFAAKAGAKVVAAADGQVALVSQSLSGLGTIVLVRHPNEFLTVYGRIDGVLVNKGDTVRRGQQIGIVSNAGAPAEPRMHFEVRRGAESLDPMTFLRS